MLLRLKLKSQKGRKVILGECLGWLSGGLRFFNKKYYDISHNSVTASIAARRRM
jgi:hypothetical protein